MEENEILDEDNRDSQGRKFDMGGLKLAFYGLLFVAINIRIQGFDIVPDVIGYILAIIGLARIEHYDENFALAKKVAYLLTVISLLNIYQAPVQNTTDQMGMMETTTSSVNYSAGLLGSNAWIAALMMILGAAATTAFAYFMCNGMKNLLMQIGDTALAKICDDRWKLILIAEIGMLGSFLLAMAGVPFGAVLALIFVVFALVVLVLFLLLVHHSYQSLDGQADRMIK